MTPTYSKKPNKIIHMHTQRLTMNTHSVSTLIFIFRFCSNDPPLPSKDKKGRRAMKKARKQCF